MQTATEKLLTATDLAHLCNVSPAKVSGLIAAGVVVPDFTCGPSRYFRLFRRERLPDLLPIVANLRRRPLAFA